MRKGSSGSRHCRSHTNHDRERETREEPEPLLLIPLLVITPPHPILDIVVEDEIQLLVREPIMPRQHTVYFINNGFRCSLSIERNQALTDRANIVTHPPFQVV